MTAARAFAGTGYRAGGLTREQEMWLRQSRFIARLMDAQWGIGKLRVGLDNVIGLIPGVGDVVSFLVLAHQLQVASRLHLPKGAQARMIANAAFDLVIGLIPFLGDIADIFFKAHMRNQRIIESTLARQGRSMSAER